MENLVNYISNKLINGINDFNAEDTKYVTNLINNTLETSILKPMKNNLTFAIDNNISIGDDIVLVYTGEGDADNIDVVYYLLSDFKLVDITSKNINNEDVRVAIIYNKVIDKTFELKNVKILSGEDDEITYSKRLMISSPTEYVDLVNKDDEVKSLTDILFKVVNLETVGDIMKNSEELLLKVDDNFLKIKNYDISLSFNRYVFSKGDVSYGFRLVIIKGVIGKDNNVMEITDENPMIIAATPKYYDNLKTITLIDIDKYKEILNSASETENKEA